MPAMRRLLDPEDVSAASLATLALAALCVAIAGYLHARLFHRGYAEVELVGPLFFLNAVGSLACVLFLAFKRVALFAISALAILVGSIVSILISHSSTFFGFAEGGYDGDGKAILIAEIAGVVLIAVGLALDPRRGRRTAAA